MPCISFTLCRRMLLPNMGILYNLWSGNTTMECVIFYSCVGLHSPTTTSICEAKVWESGFLDRHRTGAMAPPLAGGLY